MSFNSSDMEAYRHENPIPVLKQAYNEYHRNKRKARMRRAITFENEDDRELILRNSDIGIAGRRKS